MKPKKSLQKKIVLTAVLTSGLLFSGYRSTDRIAVNTNNPDADFAIEAASGGMMEVELGNVAITNGSFAGVKNFGKQMVADHTKANEDLKAKVASKDISLPSAPDKGKQKMIADLKKKTGSDFDKAYIDMMVSDHKEDIAAFQKEVKQGKDQDIKAWAGGALPTLQHHLQMAEDVQKQLKSPK